MNCTIAKKIWNSISSIGVKYEEDFFDRRNVRWLNGYTFLLICILTGHTIRSAHVFHNYVVAKIFACFILFLVGTLTVLIKLRKMKFLVFIGFLALTFLIFFLESYTNGISSGVYLYYFSLIFALPFVFNFQKHKRYIVGVIIGVVAAFIINKQMHYSMFVNKEFINNLENQSKIFYVSVFDNFVIIIFSVLFIVQKTWLVERLYSQRKIAEVEHKNMRQKVKMKHLEAVNAKQKLLISNLRIKQKNELLERAKNLDSRQISKLIRQERNKDDDFKSTTAMYLDASPEFYQALTAKAAPNKLSALDLRYCIYIYARKTNRDIAEALGINYSSVKSYKHHLKRKFNLTNEDNFDFFIQNITIPDAEAVKKFENSISVVNG